MRPPQRALERGQPRPEEREPLHLLQLCLARGEIDVEEYERLRASLVAGSDREEART